MKSTLKYILLAFVAILMCGCYKDPNIGSVPVDIQPDSTLNYDVKFLFEVEGVRVYRFFDNGNCIYFTNTTGRTSYDYTRVGGNIVTTEHVETICNGNSEKYEKEAF